MLGATEHGAEFIGVIMVYWKIKWKLLQYIGVI